MQDHNQGTSEVPLHQIRATYDETTIRVYQAYSDAIADAALAKGTFTSPPFKMERMTWIKPSFLWMMYRAGWGLKDAGQKRILAMDITRAGFEWALEHGCLSHAHESISKDEWTAKKEASPVRIQWDPERDLLLRPQIPRAIQIGLSKEAVELYVYKWITRVVDVTPLAHSIHALVIQEKFEEAIHLLVDGLKGFPQAINAVFPQTQVQTCIVHLIRNSLDFVNWKDRKLVAAELKTVYRATTEAEAVAALEAFANGPWGAKYPPIAGMWRRQWQEVIPFFAYPLEVRRIVYTTNAIESLNMQIRKVIKNRGHFPNDDAATKLIWLALRNIAKNWKMPPITWRAAKPSSPSCSPSASPRTCDEALKLAK